MMKKLKLCLSAALLLMTSGAFAQTDVTETYLQNASYAVSPKAENNGWTVTYAPADRWTWSNGVFEAYSAWSEGEAAKMKQYSMLQDVTLPAGNYRLTVNAFYRFSDKFTEFFSNAYLKAGENQCKIMCLFDSSIDNLSKAAAAFASDEYLNTLDFVLETDQTISVGITGTHPLDAGVYRSWFVAGPFKLYQLTLSELEAGFDAAMAAGQAALEDPEYANVLGNERVTLQDYVGFDKAALTTAAQYVNATQLFNVATANFISAKSAYDKLAFENARAVALGADAFVPDEGTTAAELEAVIQNLMVAEYEAVNVAYTVSIDLGEWTAVGTTTMNNQHWSGTPVNYMNQDDSGGKGWNAASWEMSCSQDITLPAGEYVFRVAARRSEGAVVALTVSDGETPLGLVNDFPVGNTGLGINTSGVASFNPSDTYANANNGYGWQWRYVPFTLEAETTVTIAVEASANSTQQWASFGDYTVMCKPNLATAMAAHAAARAEAQAILDANPKMNSNVRNNLQGSVNYSPMTMEEYNNSANVIKATILEAKASIAAYAKLKDALDKCVELEFATAVATFGSYASCKTQYDAGGYTTEQAEYYATSLPTEYRGYLKTVASSYNAATAFVANPDITTGGTPPAGWTCNTGATNNKTLTGQNTPDTDGTIVMYENWKSGGLNAGNMYQTVSNLPNGKYFVKMVAFTRTSALDDYIYIKSGANEKHGALMTAETAHISVTDAIQVSNGQVEIGLHIGSGADWAALGAVRLYAAEIDNHVRTTAVGQLGTVCLPYNATVTGANVYTAAINGSSVTLTPHVGNLVAGVAYVYEATAATQTFAWAADADLIATPTVGDLTGVFKPTVMVADNYVMQTQSGEQKFFKVAASSEPTLAAYRAYLTAPASEGKYSEYDIDHGQTTGINAINAEAMDNATIYNINGQKLSRLQKGVNIINGKKVIVK